MFVVLVVVVAAVAAVTVVAALVFVVVVVVVVVLVVVVRSRSPCSSYGYFRLACVPMRAPVRVFMRARVRVRPLLLCAVVPAFLELSSFCCQRCRSCYCCRFFLAVGATETDRCPARAAL